MKTIIFLGLATVIFNVSLAAKIVCYYSSWSIYYGGNGAVQPEDLDPNMCTHINYAFVAINEDGSLKSEDQWADIDNGGFSRVIKLKEINSNLKVLLSIGGGDAPTETFANIVADPDKRANMVQSARWYMETYGFDGVDVDWEFPGSADRDNFVALLQDLKSNFNQNGWQVTAAVSADVNEGYDVPRISDILDHINVMTYDMYGPWSQYTGQNSPLYASSVESDWERNNLNMHSALTQWKNAGANPDKIIAGMAFYGHSFELQDPENNGLHAPINGAGEGGSITKTKGSWSYLEFCQEKDSFNCEWDDEQKVPICVRESLWLGIDNEESIRAKVAYINSNGFGGAMIWTIGQDDVNGHCGNPKPLLHAIKDNLT